MLEPAGWTGGSVSFDMNAAREDECNFTAIVEYSFGKSLSENLHYGK